MQALDPHDRVVESIENRGKVVERASHDLTESGTFVFYLPKTLCELASMMESAIRQPEKVVVISGGKCVAGC